MIIKRSAPLTFCINSNQNNNKFRLLTNVDQTAVPENPCIIAFPKPHRNIDSGIVNVNHTAINQAKLKHLLDEDDYIELNNARQNWEGKQSIGRLWLL
jgi:hypothetical protein